MLQEWYFYGNVLTAKVWRFKAMVHTQYRGLEKWCLAQRLQRS